MHKLSHKQENDTMKEITMKRIIWATAAVALLGIGLLVWMSAPDEVPASSDTPADPVIPASTESPASSVPFTIPPTPTTQYPEPPVLPEDTLTPEPTDEPTADQRAQHLIITVTEALILTACADGLPDGAVLPDWPDDPADIAAMHTAAETAETLIGQCETIAAAESDRDSVCDKCEETLCADEMACCPAGCCGCDVGQVAYAGSEGTDCCAAKYADIAKRLTDWDAEHKFDLAEPALRALAADDGATALIDIEKLIAQLSHGDEATCESNTECSELEAIAFDLNDVIESCAS